MPPRFELGALLLDRGAGTRLNRQIYEQLRQMILDRTLPAGTRLPSSRSLAAALSVSRNTVVAAYEQLETEGYVSSRQGSSTEVVDLPIGQEARPVAALPDATGHLSQRGCLMIARQTHNFSLPGRPSFLPGTPDFRHFPFAVWRRLLTRRLRPGGEDVFGYHHVTGYPPLKAAIARYLETSRGVRCDPEQIVITSGAQAAFDLIARVLLDPGDAVWIEEPGYPGAQTAFEAAGARLLPLFVDRDGWNLRSLPAGPLRLIYVTPSCQSPLGVTMRMEQRLQLIETARQKNAWIVEDDFDSEYRFSGRAVPAMQGHDPTGRTIYVGTFSKTLFPGLRLGFMVLPPQLATMATPALFLTAHSAPLILQSALSDFISEGYFTVHLGRMRRLYAERREAFNRLCAEHLGEWLRPVSSDSGIQSLWLMDSPLSDLAIVEAAKRRSITVTALSSFYRHKKASNGLIFGYTALDEKEIGAELARMREVFADSGAQHPLVA